MPRHRTWADRIFNQLVNSGASDVEDLLDAVPQQSETLTVTRIIAELQFTSVVTDENESTQLISLAIGVVSPEAVAIGITALPSPSVEDEFPPRGWLYRGRMVYQLALPTGATPTSMFKQMPIFKFDVRAMRKIDKGRLFLVVQNTDVDGVATNLHMRGIVRSLCLT